jgi:hypothetical protein
MTKFLTANPAGDTIEVIPVVVSAGVADAGKNPALNAQGTLDITVLPAGVGAQTKVAIGSEALTAGDWINIYDNAGTPNIRKANATDATKPVNGFVLANFASGASVTAYLSGINNQRTGMAIGARYYASAATPGSIVLGASAPNATGNLLQYVGTPVSPTEIPFEGTDPRPILRA